MKLSLRAPLVIPLLIALLVGCGRKDQALAPTAGASGQESAAAEELALHPDYVDDGIYEVQSQAPTDAAGTAAAIDPLTFWRQITSLDRAYQFAFSDTDTTGQPTTAVITVHKRMRGWFNVLARDPASEGSPTEGYVVRKPLRDHWVRRVLLKRVDLPETPRRPWRIAAVSGVEITSRDAQTRITSLRVQAGDLDTTITDPLAFWRLRRLVRVAPGTQVTLTVTTQAADDVVVLYARDRRFRFLNNGDGTHTATWTADEKSGLRHVGVNALSHGTLFDDEAPYDSQTWILPLVVTPAEMADLAP